MATDKESQQFKYPGIRAAMDGNSAIIMCEREASDAAGAFPITPSTQMGEYWAEEAAKGHINISGRPLIFVEPEGEHAAAAVTAGMSMSGLRASNFSSGQGIAYMHESLYAAVGKRVPYVLNLGCRAMTKSSLNVHCGHDDYHCIDDTGFFQVFAKNAQEAADLNLIARKVAELSLTPAIIAQDGFLTTHLIEPLRVPERKLVSEFLGYPDDIIDCPTPAQRLLYGKTRRRVPELWSVDNPVLAGPVENQDAYMQSVVSQRPYFFDHLSALTEQVMAEYYQLTGRRYRRISNYCCDDADYIILGQGSMIVQAEAVADYLRKTRKIRVGVVNLSVYRPFPGDLISTVLKSKKGVAILERVDQPLAEDLPLMREVRASLGKCIENQIAGTQPLPWPDYPSFRLEDMPRLYSGCYGLGSRDLQPEALIAAVENMLPESTQKPFYYLSVDFVHQQPGSPTQEIYQQQLIDAYPHIQELSLKGSENPNLMPPGSVTVRMHSIGGWGAITTGKNLAMTLFDLLAFEIRANPKYGSEKKGQPTTYYLAAAPEPIRLNCDYYFVDVVMSPDPNVFSHSNPLNGLKKGGIFIIQSSLVDAHEVWGSFPYQAQQSIIDNQHRVFYIDGFKIAREEATDPEMQFRMQGNAFQGAFFAASPLMATAGLDEEALFAAIDSQLRQKFGSKGERIVQDNLRVVRRGFDEIKEITHKHLGETKTQSTKKPVGLPIMLKQLPEADGGITDIHRFWEQTGRFYASGKGQDNLADPYIGLSLIPASTGVFRDMTSIRFEYPRFIPENCTACGNCYSICPDSAIPGLVNSMTDILTTAITRIERAGQPTRFLRKTIHDLEARLRALIEPAGEAAEIDKLLDQAIHSVLANSSLHGQDKETLEQELNWLLETLGDFKFAITKPYYLNREKKQPGSGGLFSITINPYTCKGCMECVQVCNDNALLPTTQTPEKVAQLRHDWAFWLDLPTTKADFIRIDDLDERIGALETLLLDKNNYSAFSCGDGACLGCGEKTVIHLFTSTVTALMQPRIKKHLEHINDLIDQLDQHIHKKLAQGFDLSNTELISELVNNHRDSDLTLAELSVALGKDHDSDLIDTEWLDRSSQLLKKLHHLQWLYTEGQTKRGRAAMGIINSTGCSSVWGSTYPYNPYPFPWANHLFQDSPSMAMGVFQGHMTRMADGFKTLRQAELELAGNYNPQEHDEFFTYFDWHHFSEEEWLLCPPVVSIGGDGAMYDIGFQNLSRALMTKMPIKVLVLDTQVYSNTGGQACTSGFTGQVSDMAGFGKVWKGKPEIRKELGLIGIAHRNAFVMQGSTANITHLLEGFISGLNSHRPALFNIYTPCQPEHGIGDDAARSQSKRAMESRAYPLFRFDPDAGDHFTDCIDLEGNPALDADWPSYKLDYLDGQGQEQQMELPVTFVDFAITEARFRKHFRQAPPDTWNDRMLPLDEFLTLNPDDREGKFPYIWGVDKNNRLIRAMVTAELVQASEDRRDYWRLLKSIAGLEGKVDVNEIVRQTRTEMAQQLTARFLAMANGTEMTVPSSLTLDNSSATAAATMSATAKPGPVTKPEQAATTPVTSNQPVWIDTPECSSCDECITINPKIFAYNDQKKAIVINPQGGPYKDIVRAAEKCSSGCIHPGAPFNPDEKNLEQLIKRAEKYQ